MPPKIEGAPDNVPDSADWPPKIEGPFDNVPDSEDWPPKIEGPPEGVPKRIVDFQFRLIKLSIDSSFD